MAIVHAAAPGNSQAINETYAYNNRLQLTGINDSSASGPLLNLTFGYSQTSGNNGSVASVANNSDGSRTQTFTYDSLNRILSAQSQATSGTNCWGLNFGIDAIANLLSENVTKCSANPLSVSVNAKNWITNTNFNYDADGNLTSNGGSPYVYDAESRVTSAAGTSYSYDGNGLRVMKSGGTIYWRGVGGNTLAETTGSGGLTSEYIFFGGRRIARRDSSNNVSYYLTDHLGSVRVVTNSSGAPCYQADYTPYGLEMTPAGVTNTCPLNYKFTGYERDTESGLDYAIARYYSSGLGRFVSVDPMGGSASDPQSWNAYSYVHNKPLNFTDPSGLCSEDDTSDCPGYGGGILTYGSGSGSSGGFSWSWWFGSSDVPPWDPYYYSLPLGGFNVGVVSPDTHYVYTYHAISIPSQSYPSDGSILSHMANDCSNCIGTFGGAYDMVETAASLTAQAGLIVSGFEFPLVAKFLHALTLASNVPVPDGSFSIRDWSGYPEGLPRPQGPFRRLSPIEYKDARQAANAANRALRSQTPGIEGMEVHEIHPVILGGSPTSLSNKAILTEEMHSAYTIWWNRVLRAVRTIPE